MPSGTKEIQRRIRSVGNTKKITKAMELVAASKMRKAVNAVLGTREYSNTAWRIIQDLSATTDPRHHILLQQREQISRIAAVLVSSNRGLCGGFNREIVDETVRYCQSQDTAVDVISMGTKGQAIRKRGYEIVADFEKADVAESVREIQGMSKLVIDDYISGKYDKVVIAYTDYQSAIKQVPRVRQLLPIVRQDSELGSVDRQPEERLTEVYEYAFEPSPAAVLEQMLYRVTELQIFQAVLESNASEHSARMIAMRNASDAASDMIDDLTLTFNQARQQSITSELAEISASRAAIE